MSHRRLATTAAHHAPPAPRRGGRCATPLKRRFPMEQPCRPRPLQLGGDQRLIRGAVCGSGANSSSSLSAGCSRLTSSAGRMTKSGTRDPSNTRTATLPMAQCASPPRPCVAIASTSLAGITASCCSPPRPLDHPSSGTLSMRNDLSSDLHSSPGLRWRHWKRQRRSGPVGSWCLSYVRKPSWSGNFALGRRRTPVRKLTFSMTMTVDGFVSGPNGELDWMASNSPRSSDTSAITTLAPI